MILTPDAGVSVTVTCACPPGATASGETEIVIFAGLAGWSEFGAARTPPEAARTVETARTAHSRVKLHMA